MGFTRMPRSQQDLQAVARAVEAGGFWGLGVGDSHFLYHELYTSITACLMSRQIPSCSSTRSSGRMI